ncbi:MAG: NUDIX hydrolase [Paludibacter sp.]|nr:NUDIX hydrolase [Paludibacter sp.]MBP7611833.1 NUDIX hydrolase [Paludibacter sp.]MBV5282991.1 NUDIX hydrolase [Paludibacter sp.]
MTASFYKNRDTHLIAVDCIIMGFKDNDLHVLAAKRQFEPMKGGWSLMGGFVNQGESINEAAGRVLDEFTGIDGIFMEQLGAYGEVERDLGERVVSIAYYALVDMDKFDTSLVEKYDARWISISHLPELIFDHNKMVRDTINTLQRRAAVKPIGFNLLGDQFTLPSLQSLYEAIYQETIDKRNFRKKILSMDILEKLDEKDKSSSKRGAFYYQFNKDKYDQLIQQGLHFSL